MTLTAETVTTIVTTCLYTKKETGDATEAPEGAVIGEGVLTNFSFHPERLEAHRADIVSLLSFLSDDFKASGGGGMSFLNMPFDKNNNHWGEHRECEALCALGHALGIVSYLFPRTMWKDLPGGMPYVVLHDTPPDSH